MIRHHTGQPLGHRGPLGSSSVSGLINCCVNYGHLLDIISMKPKPKQWLYIAPLTNCEVTEN